MTIVNSLPHDQKELIWVTKETAEAYKQLETVEEQEKMVKKIIHNKRLDIEGEQELLEENLLVFKGVCLAHRKELSKVYGEQNDLLEKLWEEVGDISGKINESAGELAAKIKPLKDEVACLKREIEGLRLFVPDQLTRLAATVKSMDEDTRSLLRDLLNLKAGE
jgi:archaellum component FlaC